MKVNGLLVYGLQWRLVRYAQLRRSRGSGARRCGVCPNGCGRRHTSSTIAFSGYIFSIRNSTIDPDFSPSELIFSVFLGFERIYGPSSNPDGTATQISLSVTYLTHRRELTSFLPGRTLTLCCLRELGRHLPPMFCSSCTGGISCMCGEHEAIHIGSRTHHWIIQYSFPP